MCLAQYSVLDNIANIALGLTEQTRSYLKLIEIQIINFSKSVYRHATGWTVRGSNPGGGRYFRSPSVSIWGPLSVLHHGYRVVPGVKAVGA
jgi:hypothetical protein